MTREVYQHAKARRHALLSHGSWAVLAVIGFVLGQTLVADDADPQAQARKGIAEASRAFSEAYVSNDTDALKNLYSEDALLLPPGSDVRGRDAAGQYFRWGPRYRQLAHSMTSSELMIRGDIAVDVGTWHSTNQRGEDPPATASGRYLVVWVRHSDGRWRMQYDMWHRPATVASKTTGASP